MQSDYINQGQLNLQSTERQNAHIGLSKQIYKLPNIKEKKNKKKEEEEDEKHQPRINLHMKQHHKYQYLLWSLLMTSALRNTLCKQLLYPST